MRLPSHLKNYFKSKALDDMPNIDKLRLANDTNGYISALCCEESVESKICLVGFYPTVELERTLLAPDANLLQVSDFYFGGVDTWFGQKPFEVFILNKTYREDIGTSMTRVDFFDLVSANTPFLKELIIDTCNFIVTGRRDINVHILKELRDTYKGHLVRSANPSFPELNVKQRFNWKDIENMSSQEFYSAWVKSRLGLEDMICSYKILLGL